MSGDSDRSEPLENRKFKVIINGQVKKLTGVDPYWMDSKRLWTKFVAPDWNSPDPNWRNRCKCVIQDLEYLLSLDYHQFWSQMVFDKTLKMLLGFLLQNLPRPYDLYFNELMSDGETKRLIGDVMHKAFLVFVRLSTFKESDKNFMSSNYFKDIIYKDFLIDIPKIMDISLLFHRCSPKITEKMIENVFKHQSNYLNDLNKTIDSISATMKQTIIRVEKFVFQDYKEEKLNELIDIIAYSCDITNTISAFMTTYPISCLSFNANSFESILGDFYENVCIKLIKYLLERDASNEIDEILFKLLIDSLSKSRIASIKILRQILNETFLKTFSDSKVSADTKERNAMEYCSTMNALLLEGTLILDYSNKYSLYHDIELITNAKIEIDVDLVASLLEGVDSLKNDNDRQDNQSEEVSDEDVVTTYDIPEISNKLIAQVRDLLPDLGEGFVEACLKYYDNDTEKVINAIFEENLPPHLIDMDRNAPKLATVQKKETTQRRINVFDNDEFDINTRDSVDMSRVHRGKRDVAKNALDLLDDKRELAPLKEKFSELGIVMDEVLITPGAYDANYDDEYDDTYDENAIGQNEPDSNESFDGRAFVLPQALGGGHIKHVQEKKYVEEDDEEDRKKLDHFVRNPEEVRAEAERRRQTKMQNRNKNYQPPTNRDVVGKAKGQGQDKQVLINRSRKNANKGKNHRVMADKKMSKGMF